MKEAIRGTIERVYHSSPSFSAGVLQSEDGQRVRFAGKFCASDGDVVAMMGHWKNDSKYGRQFVVESLGYDLPESAEGLVQYLAKHPAFTGIGETTARKIVNYATSSDNLNRLIRQGVDELHHATGISKVTLENFRDAWIANSAENEVRAYLAGFGLTQHQTDTLLNTFGNAIIGVLRADPYQLIQHVKGYGFKKVDKIARAMGTAKDHPGRIEAGILYVHNDEISSGHTWTPGSVLIDKANELLLLDTLDNRTLIQQAAQRLLANGDLVADGQAVTTKYFLESESTIRDALEEHGWRSAPTMVESEPDGNLRAGQIQAIQCALSHRIAVISGGAGTGKTYCLAQIARAFVAAGLRIALCAPTGKAAKRIEETLGKHGLKLEAKTIHRLLEYDGDVFNRGSLSENENRVDEEGNQSVVHGYQVVIVDEVSMVDVPLMAELIERIDFDHTRLILVGDHNQLPPVGPGNILRDIIAHKLAPTVVLTEVVRQAGILKANSTAILDQIIAPTSPSDSAWTVVDCFSEAPQIQVYLRDLVLERIPKRLNIDPIRDVQILTPTHIGPLGTKAINQMMQQVLHGDVGRKFAAGDKVIQTSNDYDLGVMNGTIGYVQERDVDGGYRIAFEGTAPLLISGEKLQRIQLAYALTAHKAQGSEFPCVVVICHRSHFFADRNWLYTAVTRAAKYCILMGDRWGLRHAVKKCHTLQRRTFLDHWARCEVAA